MRVIIFIFMGVFLGGTASAGQYIDKDQKEIDLKRQKFVRDGFKKCNNKKFETIGEREECTKPVLIKAAEKYPKRGTETYSKKNYSNISKKEAISQLRRLKALFLRVEDNYSNGTGIIVQDDVSREGWWIQTNVLDIPNTGGYPWFIECDGKAETKSGLVHIEKCPLEKGEDD